MALRMPTLLPRGLRQAIFAHLQPSAYRSAPRNAFVWTRNTRSYAQGPVLSNVRTAQSARNYLWLLPVAGGFALYLSPKPESIFPVLLSSPTIIPCNEDREPFPDITINSPEEPRRSILSFFLTLFRDRVWEPVLTARRFLHLLYLFLPVFLTAPMLLVGKPERALGGDRWGAVWWYGYLTTQMQRAGPTFVKVRGYDSHLGGA